MDNSYKNYMKPDIGIVYPDYYSEKLGEIITADIVHPKLNLDIRRQEILIYECVEWALPGLIAAYILKPYFDGFLKEAGKEHYQLLKLSLKKLLKMTKGAKEITLAANQSVHKLSKSNTQSKGISIHIELKNGKIIKLLFDNELDLEVWSSSLDEMLKLVLDNYENYPNDELSVKLKPLANSSYVEIFSVINKKTHEWEYFDLKQAVNINK